MAKPLKIVIVSSEVDPFSKTGGLADVARSLSKALKGLGHKIIVITPLYGTIDKKKHHLKQIFKDIEIEIDSQTTLKASYWQGELMNKLPIYFIDNGEYFSQKSYIYGSREENARFLFFDLAVIKLIELLNFMPDVIHCHDWHTGLIPYFIKKRLSQNPIFKKVASVFTIHNLSFQMGNSWWEVPQEKKDDGHSDLPSFGSKELKFINFARRGILYSDLVNTVSETYAEEILKAEFGQGLNRILRAKNKKGRFFGIINGIDQADYNPATDPGLAANYTQKTLSKMIENKIFLQKKFNLPQNPDIPILGMVTRITEQKGFDLLIKIIDTLLRLNLQLVLVGGGNKHYEKFFRKLSKKNPKKVAAHLEFEAKYATQIYAGSDMFLMPSRFEPCGLGQLISLRYGSVPIVRATGGLLDTITDFNPKTGKGNGFVFKTYHPQDFLVAIVRGLETYKYKDVWQKLIKNGMKQSFSWEIPARKYVRLYRKAVKINKLMQNKK